MSHLYSISADIECVIYYALSNFRMQRAASSQIHICAVEGESWLHIPAFNFLCNTLPHLLHLAVPKASIPSGTMTTWRQKANHSSHNLSRVTSDVGCCTRRNGLFLQHFVVDAFKWHCHLGTRRASCGQSISQRNLANNNNNNNNKIITENVPHITSSTHPWEWTCCIGQLLNY